MKVIDEAGAMDESVFWIEVGISAEAANYPFCTIEPNEGTIPVPDERINILSDIAKSRETIPTSLTFYDIAGLVKGASKGEGLGNKFLSHIREVDAIIHVVRCFEDENITHVNNEINPLDDIETINTELILSDLELIEKIKSGLTKKSKSGDEESVKKVAASEMLIKHLESGNQVISFPDISKINETIKEFNLITNKPVLYVCNVDEKSITEGNNYTKLFISKFGIKNTILISAEIENQINQLENDEKINYMKMINLKETGLNTLIKKGYELLELETFFTSGPEESRAWTVPINCKAPYAAGTIHTDFEKGFIRAETVSYEEFIKNNGWLNSKNNGKMRLEGKDYIVKDGDVLNFRFNT